MIKKEQPKTEETTYKQPEQETTYDQSGQEYNDVIRSISDANHRLESWNPENKRTQGIPNYLVDKVLGDRNVTGNSSEYHNFASEFARNNLYIQATMIAVAGVKKYPNNVDLLADVVHFGSQCQDWKNCEFCYEKLKNIGTGKWTWRAFTFTIDYLFEKMETEMEADNLYDTIKIKEIENLISQYKLLKDERAWVAESELYLKLGDIDKSITILKDCVESVEVAPQCCIKLVDCLLERGEYEDVIEYAAIGIRSTAQDQPSASNGYLIYASALAKDALIHKEELENSKKEIPDINKGFNNLSAVNDALLDYKIAKQLLSTQTYVSNIMQRELILRAKSGIEDTERNDLIKSLLQQKFSELANRDNS